MKNFIFYNTSENCQWHFSVGFIFSCMGTFESQTCYITPGVKKKSLWDSEEEIISYFMLWFYVCKWNVIVR